MESLDKTIEFGREVLKKELVDALKTDGDWIAGSVGARQPDSFYKRIKNDPTDEDRRDICAPNYYNQNSFLSKFGGAGLLAFLRLLERGKEGGKLINQTDIEEILPALKSSLEKEIGTEGVLGDHLWMNTMGTINFILYSGGEIPVWFKDIIQRETSDYLKRMAFHDDVRFKSFCYNSPEDFSELFKRVEQSTKIRDDNLRNSFPKSINRLLSGKQIVSESEMQEKYLLHVKKILNRSIKEYYFGRGNAASVEPRRQRIIEIREEDIYNNLRMIERLHGDFGIIPKIPKEHLQKLVKSIILKYEQINSESMGGSEQYKNLRV